MSLKYARWIWFPEGSPASSAPVATRYFRRTVEIAPSAHISRGDAVLTADNSFTLLVNGHAAGTGSNFNINYDVDITPLLKTGSNSIEIDAVNEGDSPNPAGVIGAFAITFKDRSVQQFVTGPDWNAFLALGDTPVPAMDLGPMSMSPWSKSDISKQIYPDYSSIAGILKSRGIKPDFTASAPIRYTHRHLADGGDIYFVSNIEDQEVSTNAVFRTAGREPEWWNPLDGTSRVLQESMVAGGSTTVPLRLEPRESGFVVFQTPRVQHNAHESNFPINREVETLANPWSVAFDPAWGGPANTTFAQLTDWSASSDPGIRYYSGTAVYSTTFDAPIQSLSGSVQLSLSLGDVKDLATVTLNGQGLGIAWCAPWRVAIPAGLVKPTGNELKISVANLWINRLIGDSALPEAQRLTSTNGNDYSPNSPLQPSGLLGPVKLLAASP
jgi:hypothetical protein